MLFSWPPGNGACSVRSVAGSSRPSCGCSVLSSSDTGPWPPRVMVSHRKSAVHKRGLFSQFVENQQPAKKKCGLLLVPAGRCEAVRTPAGNRWGGNQRQTLITQRLRAAADSCGKARNPAPTAGNRISSCRRRHQQNVPDRSPVRFPFAELNPRPQLRIGWHGFTQPTRLREGPRASEVSAGRILRSVPPTRGR